MAEGGLLRLLTGDELGYVRCVQACGAEASQLSAASVVARWGDGARARGVERLCVTDGEDWSVRSLLAGAARGERQRDAAVGGSPTWVRLHAPLSQR